ncbi:uncharacterized protein LOC116345476 isoform X2 [Contarinia nasturtii]|nr:uncharacterized protein LOC116345476 isoform X2 [Contarinia nasturtii]
MKLFTISRLLVMILAPIMVLGGTCTSKDKNGGSSSRYGSRSSSSVSTDYSEVFAPAPVCPATPFYQKITLPQVYVYPTHLETIRFAFPDFMAACSAKPDSQYLKLRFRAMNDPSIQLPRWLLPGEYDDLNVICNQINGLGEKLEKACYANGYNNFKRDYPTIKTLIKSLKSLYNQSSNDMTKRQCISLVCYDLHTLTVYMNALNGQRR